LTVKTHAICGATSAPGVGEQHRLLYQIRQNPYSWKLFGEL